ncbi:MAG TPA: glycosyl hydrolase [Solirubrobacteraceae bacterium]|nr:glycosyl hydrolase [Solirubrobacteraceae bacterium]
MSLLCAAAPAKALTLGIADQKPGTFHDQRLTELGVRHARLSVPWDAMRYTWQQHEIDAWMAAASAASVQPLVTFGRSRTRKFSLPKASEYRREVLRFRRRYPLVREYSPWNEPNIAVRAKNFDPERIASYYRLLRRMCPKCTVLGADVVDTSSLARWMRAYLREFPRDERPRLWGLHNYVDVNSSSSWGTQVMRRLAPGEIWFTETGAIVRRKKPTQDGAPDRRTTIRIGASRAVEATKRVFRLAATSPRITRVYIYHWKASQRSSWDSGLVAPNGALRPSFDIFAAQARAALAQEEPPPAAQ